MQDPPAALLATAETVRVLDVSNNRFRVLHESLAALTHLERLTAAQNHIAVIECRFEALQRLRVRFFWHCLAGQGVPYCSPLRMLRTCVQTQPRAPCASRDHHPWAAELIRGEAARSSVTAEAVCAGTRP